MLKFFKSFFHKRQEPPALPTEPQVPYKIETPVAPVAESASWPFPTSQPEAKSEPVVQEKKPAAKSREKKPAEYKKTTAKPAAPKKTAAKKPAK